MATSLQRPPRILIVSFVVSTVIAVVEIIGGVLSDSISLMSDAVHVFIDVMAIGLSLCNNNSGKKSLRRDDIWLP